MSSSQNPYDRKDNKKSTETSNISPGEPLWSSRDHIQQSFGQGYDFSDPVSFLKGDTTNEGGYESGNAIDRFGTFSLREQRYSCSHGTVIEVIIDRKGGDVGEFEFYIKMDTEPIVGRPDPNTGVIGVFETSVEHGFYTCKVDLDMYTLNKNVDGISYDFTTNTMYVIFRNKELQKRLRFLVPYRTQVAPLLPIDLQHDFTYKIDEYELLDVRNMDPQPPVSLIEGLTDCQPGRVVPLTTTLNRKCAYSTLCLPLPQPFTEPQGSDPAEIDVYNNTLFHRLSTSATKYTIGKTRSVEGAVLASGDISTATGSVSGCLSAVRALHGDESVPFNLYWSNVFNPLSGKDKHLVISDQLLEPDPKDIPGYPNTVTPVSAIEFGYKNVPGFEEVYGDRFTGYESYIFNVGDDPSVSENWKLHENDPGGFSDFKSLPAPEDRVIEDGDPSTTYGNVKYTMFTGKAVDPTGVAQVTYYMENEDASHLDSLDFPTRLGKTEVATFSAALSASANAWNIGSSLNSEIGQTLIDTWVVNDNSGYKPGAGEGGTSNILYNLSAIVTDEANYQKNINNLRAYYMTCDDHQSKDIYLIFDSSLADPPMEIRNNRMQWSISKLQPYDVDRHALYDDLVYPSRKMKHGLGITRSYRSKQSWSDTLSGDNLMFKLFSPLAPLIQTRTPAFTGYTDFGAISADDILFLSFQQGVIPGDPGSVDPDPGADGPELKVINTGDDDDASGVGIGNDYTTHVVYKNIGDMNMWMDFQYLGETRPGAIGSWTLSLSSTNGGTTATRSGTNQFMIKPAEQVTVVYTTTIIQDQIDAGEDSYDHTYLLDYGSKDPGVSFPTTTINITI